MASKDEFVQEYAYVEEYDFEYPALPKEEIDEEEVERGCIIIEIF